MTDFSDYFSDALIVKILCKHRAKISHRRHKKHMMRDISLHQKTNKIEILDTDIEFKEVQSFFPTRRNWIKLNQTERLHPNRFNTSIEKNEMRLWKSYICEKHLIERNNKIPETWYLNLINFCEGIRKSVEDAQNGKYKLSKPTIFPLLKSTKNKEFIYRPIAKYSLKDKIITSLLTRYLTVKFDNIFLNCSYAFRGKINGKIPSHHDSVVEILKYRKKNKKLWVSECDIQKFYDTVQHDYLISVFDELIIELEKEDILISDIAKTIFLLFLESYSFNEDVQPKNQQPKFFEENGVIPGKFGWVEDELNCKYPNNYTNSHKIGVPQGNAVSCFIANLILHKVDKMVKNVDENIFYVRYCDDMVLAHPQKEVCLKALEVYEEGMKDSFLLYHEPKKFKNYKDSPKAFWEAKSKKPYFWGNKYCGVENMPWLSFVGYQINYKGEIRVRKSSIKKEIKKQIAETQSILDSLGLDKYRNLENINEFSRKTQKQISFSLQQRLISMSVGRVTIYNHDDGHQGLCWTNGFKLLKKNKITTKQLKHLDRRREQQISYLKRAINHLNKETEEGDFDDLPEYMKDLYFGLPYSYYNHLS